MFHNIKKVFIIILIVSLVILTACYGGWKTIKINGVGSLKVPENWVYTEEEGISYFTNKPINEDGYNIYLVEPVISNDNEGDDIISNKLFGDAKFINSTTIDSYSNSAGYGQQEYEHEDNIYIKYVIGFYGNKRELTLIAWDDLVDEDTIKKIAKSYVIEMNDE